MLNFFKSIFKSEENSSQQTKLNNNSDAKFPNYLIVKVKNYVNRHIQKNGYSLIDVDNFFDEFSNEPSGILMPLIEYASNLVSESKIEFTNKLEKFQPNISKFVNQFIKEDGYPEIFSLNKDTLKTLSYMLKEDFNADIPLEILEEYVDKEINVQNLIIFEKFFINDNPELINNINFKDWIKSYINTFGNNFNYRHYLQDLLESKNIEFDSDDINKKGIEKVYIDLHNEVLYEDNLSDDFINKVIEEIINKQHKFWKIYFLRFYLDKELEERHLRELAKTFKENMNSGKKVEDSSLSILDIDVLNGIEFEHILGKLFSKMGYKIEVTKGSRDQGADLIVEKIGKRTVVQAKCYSNVVSNKAIQEAVAAKAHYDCQSAMVVTNNYFTKSAIELAMSNNVELWDREVLEENLRLYPVIL